jgi:hypothetical protein
MAETKGEGMSRRAFLGGVQRLPSFGFLASSAKLGAGWIVKKEATNDTFISTFRFAFIADSGFCMWIRRFW